MLERGLGEAKQDALLAAHATQIADQLTLDTVLRARPDAMHELDQQIDAGTHTGVALPPATPSP
jgi:hypothetical protein